MLSNDQPAVGEGPSVRVSLSLPEGTAAAIRDITGRREFSAYIAEAVEHRLRSELIAQDLEAYQREHGRFTDEERAWARAALTGEADASGATAA